MKFFILKEISGVLRKWLTVVSLVFRVLRNWAIVKGNMFKRLGKTVMRDCNKTNKKRGKCLFLLFLTWHWSCRDNCGRGFSWCLNNWKLKFNTSTCITFESQAITLKLFCQFKCILCGCNKNVKMQGIINLTYLLQK